MKHFQDLRDKVDLPVIPITNEELEILNANFPVAGEMKMRDTSLCRLRGNRKNCHWKASPYRFQGVNQSCFACKDVKVTLDADTCIKDDSASISLALLPSLKVFL